jgi:proteasome lid subunit RPN8/RPN11
MKPPYLWLTRAQAHSIVALARQMPDQEVCGFIVGREQQALVVIPIGNIAPNPQQRFIMEPQQQIQALMRLQREKLEVLAIFHSHPTTEPLPSLVDVAEFAYPDALCLIVSLQHAQARFAAWAIQGLSVNPVPLYLQDSMPEPEVNRSTARRTVPLVVWLAAIIAVMSLIGASIALLPPAPVIP